MVKRILPLILLFVFLQAHAQDEQLIFKRISYVFQLKPQVAKVWPGFDEATYDVPLLYFTDSSTYVANPTPAFLQLHQAKQVYQDAFIRVYRTHERLDEAPFHMEVGLYAGDEISPTGPLMYASSLETTQQVIPDVPDTETWVSMIMHEYFHGFQFKHPDYIQWALNSSFLAKDSLIRYYRHEPGYRAAIDRENDLLLQAIAEQNPVLRQQLIQEFFSTRQQRRAQSSQAEAIEKTEHYYETMEGTARYMEEKLYQLYTTKAPDTGLSRADTAYHSYRRFKQYKLEKEPWMYKPKHTSYLYAIGFNMARLLDTLGIAYKERLFKEPALSLETLLQQYIEQL